MSKKAVVIEDHPLFGNSLKSIFTDLGYSPVFLHTSAAEALECIRREQPDLVATDIC
jgi:CheY-like chemotaxis protein